MPLTFLVPTLFGLEGLVGDELRRLNMKDVRVENGRVFCVGEVADLPRLNLNLRMGERVLIVLGSYPAPTFEALFEGAKALLWEDFLPKNATFPVKGHSLDSSLFSVPSCQSILKKAVATRLGEHYHLVTLPETGPLYQIQFSIRKDIATLMLDTTGPGLYKRGYRAVGVAAPLRETLAAALVTLSRYRGKDPFCDPFCGSGTIPIEAAYIAKNRAPGLNRAFSAQLWPNVDPKHWRNGIIEAKDKEFHGNYVIWGSDVDPQAIAIAQANAQKAGVADCVTFRQADALSFHPEEPRGRVVTNPPYGERLMEKREAEKLYRQFGRVWKSMPPGWSLALLSSHTEFERAFGRPADKKRKLYNGMLKCDLFLYGGSRPSGRREEGP